MENIQTRTLETTAGDFSNTLLPLAARILLALPFLPSGAGKIFGFAGTQQMMAAEGMPLTAFFLAGAIAFELIGGLSLLLGFKARWGAILLIIFLIPATLIFHDFWTFTGAQQMEQMTHFLKNLGLIGGLCAIAAFGAGRLSLDNYLSSNKEKSAQYGA